ncbi:MAG TPA: T9SS type A sorting domain-containing protein, partial [Flavisolibacter sp.]|nr:T9SS type A sorting domain-containing protein [Flavisolibacter sp.]
FTATITGQQNLTTPNFCLYDTAGNIVQCNPTGVFSNIPYGSYCIRIQDGCIDTTIQRCFTEMKPTPVITNVVMAGVDCSTFNATATGLNLISPNYCLYDSLGNVVTCDSAGVFNGLPYGSYCVRAISCGDTTASYCFSSYRPVPSVASFVQVNNKQCSGFRASIVSQTNLTNPDYCLYTSATDSLISCNTTGVFDNVPYGSYCIKIHNTCYDTVITRCFTQLRPVPSVNATMQTSNLTCSTLTIKVTGSNLTSPQYCLYDSTDTQVMCNSTGTFSNIPYGPYCVTVHDGCVDTTMRICQTFRPVHGFTLATSKVCTIGMANVNITFISASAPYTVQAFNPDGSKVFDSTINTATLNMILPGLPTGAKYKVIGLDNCGYQDSLSITPDASIVHTTTSVRAKCPSSTWANGSGDIQANSTSNLNALIPQIIQKNGVAFNKSYSSYNASTGIYSFADLEPATYVMEYTMQTCNTKTRDTVTVPSYVYPTQGQSAIYQCDNNSLSLGADVQGGISPYTYQIIGSNPASPDITSVPQSSPIFNINNGTVYSLVRLRSVDACGNATLNDVSVLPLQNLSITASGTCFYQNITLAVDTIKNASYQWFRKTTTTDSTLVDSTIVYNLPFFRPEQSGQYICKVDVNQGCAIRLAYFNLDGNCGYIYLANKMQLQGVATSSGNKLTWAAPDTLGVRYYEIERRTEFDNQFTVIGKVTAHTGAHTFVDDHPGAGSNFYRLKLLYNENYTYSNEVRIEWVRDAIVVYPNPAYDQLHISVNAQHISNYTIELLNAGGQSIYSTSVKNTRSATVIYNRRRSLQPGIYIVRITDQTTGKTEIRKILFQ